MLGWGRGLLLQIGLCSQPKAAGRGRGLGRHDQASLPIHAVAELCQHTGCLPSALHLPTNLGPHGCSPRLPALRQGLK